jgi:hypothetical protein
MASPALPAGALRDPALLRYATDPRTADWRFLLPALPRGAVLCIGGALSLVPLALESTAREVVVLAPAADLAVLEGRAQAGGATHIQGIATRSGDTALRLPAGRFELVAALRPVPGVRAPDWQDRDLATLASRVAPGGRLYLEIARPTLRHPPRELGRRLRRLGFGATRAYWPKPDFAHCELLLPLGDRQLQAYYLAEMFFAMSIGRRIVRAGLWGAVRLGVFERLLPGYLMIAGRTAEWRDGDAGAD